MARKKVKLAWIASDGTRKSCFRKRRAGLLKKVTELATLCGVDVAIAIFSPDYEPAFWPSKSGVEEMFRRYEEIPIMERSKKMLSQENFLGDRINKMEEQTRKCLKRSVEMEMNELIHLIVNENQMYELSIHDLTNVMLFLEEKKNDVFKRAQHLNEFLPINGNTTTKLSSPLPLGLTSAPVLQGGGPSGGLDTEGRAAMDCFMWDKWMAEKSLGNIAGWNGQFHYQDILAMSHGNSNFPALGNEIVPAGGEIRSSSGGNDMEFAQGSSDVAMTDNETWIPCGNIGSSSAGGLQMGPLNGNTEFSMDEIGLLYGYNIGFSSGGNQLGLLHGNTDLMGLSYGLDRNTHFRGGINGRFDADAHGYSDFIKAGNQMGLPYGMNPTFGDEIEIGVVPHGNTGMTMVGNEIGLSGGSISFVMPHGNNTAGAVVGNEIMQAYISPGGGENEMEMAQVDVGGTSGGNAMGLPQEIVGTSSTGDYMGQQHDLNYQAWFDSSV